MAQVEIRNLGKVYPGKVRAVSGASADIADGEFIVLVGPSGCGKSTILRMIAGLEEVSEGDLFIGGDRVNDLEPGERDIAMVFQNYALYPHMTVRRNMEYGLRNEGLPKDQIAARIAEAARTLRLEEYLDRKPRQLSGGQRQRVAMGRAIVREPKAFLFDEPLSNLDAKLRTQLRAELRALHVRLGATFIYVTHDQVEAMSLADRIIVMNAGQIEQIGAPLELYQKPATRFVAEFIGTPAMNFVEARPVTAGLKIDLPEGASLPGPCAMVDQLAAPAHIGFRPEDLVLEPQDGAAGLRLDLQVMFAEQLGADTVIHARLAGQSDPVTIRVESAQNPAPGATMTAYAPNAALHVFDAATGQRL
ncbi:sn-glycerol-3-phosphate ABC transporter ATP-binding protein UgpC [Aliishimia ponticola]|uniref:sn-glycerol-3-phosphate ABC transporter ATP-binding protein UgpC n=1 Tax=Aliishimia ponticola TaxID=2499833 RepID=A0A4V3XKH0_9RHOB|nr:sn-glycerol-3-phosphate ABC transporter ATP-binding protein UgpC [Aliishimia ponticola]THH36943.1 sn-glycerol-3-phosphate ABC transporter ATP-binding protein UgpC [Aliishimia ponticola]